MLKVGTYALNLRLVLVSTRSPCRSCRSLPPPAHPEHARSRAMAWTTLIVDMLCTKSCVEAAMRRAVCRADVCRAAAWRTHRGDGAAQVALDRSKSARAWGANLNAVGRRGGRVESIFDCFRDFIMRFVTIFDCSEM